MSLLSYTAILISIFTISCTRNDLNVSHLYVNKNTVFIDELKLNQDGSYTRSIWSRNKEKKLILKNKGDWDYNQKDLTLSSFLIRKDDKILVEYMKGVGNFEDELIDVIVPIEKDLFGCLSINIEKFNSFSSCK
ncbi:MAG: hypothetical protein ACPGSD_15355 [Flavobacteriales bacterium]